MQLDTLLDQNAPGAWRPVYVLVGAESFLQERAIDHLRRWCLGEGLGGLNEDLLRGKGLAASTILAVCRTVPMFGQGRLVLVRNVEAMALAELEKLAGYLGEPTPTTCLILAAEKLDGRSRFAKAAKGVDGWVDTGPLKPRQLGRFVVSEARSRGHRCTGPAAEALTEAIGNDLSALADAVERLSLFVGEGADIDAQAVASCITRTRVETVWTLVDALATSDRTKALAAATSLLQNREPPLRILAMVARQVRTLAFMHEALADGQSASEAAQVAGAPAFKARELAGAARRFDFGTTNRAVRILAQADRDLKSSRVAADIIVQRAILGLVS